MAGFFFYGTLCDPQILEIVIGGSTQHLSIEQAKLAGFQSYWAQGRYFPAIVAEPGSECHGVYVDGLTPNDTARLEFFEGGLFYDVQSVQVLTPTGSKTANFFGCPDPSVATSRRWDIQEWQHHHGPIMRRASQELMDNFGILDVADIEPKYNMMEARAHSWDLAQKSDKIPTEQGAGDRCVTVHAQRRAYTNFFAVSEFTLSHRRFDGSMSRSMERAVFMGSDAAMVLPYDPKTDQILLIEQFRMGPFARGDRKPWLFEPIAGMIDVGETPHETAIRETKEEAGITARKIIPMFDGYPSPGGTTTYFYQFLGICDLSNYAQTQAGLATEGEDIRPKVVSFEWAWDWVISGQCRVLPLTAAILWLDHYRRTVLVTG